ncbi:MAG: hypothetical protein IKP06_07610 [Elusimicrobiaceae bacterium]|nr:hypothetical protein [Elusimicrobiaceae bacterium]
MTTGIWITLIICGTLVLISIISAVGKANERKQAVRQLDDFKKRFPGFDEKNQDNENNDYFKKF